MSSPGRESSRRGSWLTCWAGGVSLHFCIFCLQGLWTLLLWCSAAAVAPSQDWLCSSQKNDCLHRAVYGRSSCQNPVSGELFVIALLSDVLLKSFLLEHLVLFQCTVVILVCNCLYWKMASLQEWHVMNDVYSHKLGPTLGWGRNQTWQGTISGNRQWAHAPTLLWGSIPMDLLNKRYRLSSGSPFAPLRPKQLTSWRAVFRDFKYYSHVYIVIQSPDSVCQLPGLSYMSKESKLWLQFHLKFLQTQMPSTVLSCVDYPCSLEEFFQFSNSRWRAKQTQIWHEHLALHFWSLKARCWNHCTQPSS